ncbi:MAG: class I SAM-dependent methyltransferase [Candidatus Woesearchaeota archaeon]
MWSFNKEERIERRIQKKIKRLLKHGMDKEVKDFLKFQEKSDSLDKKMFWDLNSSRWEKEVPKKIRNLIKSKLKVLKGKNLSLGSGSHPYVGSSVLVDFSSEMLKKAKGKKKIVLNLDQGKLPFNKNAFDSVTMVFIVDYLKNLPNLFKEVKRVLKKNGKLIIVNTKNPNKDFYRKYQVKHYNAKELKKLLKEFDAKIEEFKVEKHILVFIEGKVYK